GQPHVARSVHPEASRAGPRRPRGVRKGIPLLPVPPQDGRVACEPHVSRAASPDNRESLSRGNGNDSPGPRTTDAPDHAAAVARSEPDRQRARTAEPRATARNIAIVFELPGPPAFPPWRLRRLTFVEQHPGRAELVPEHRKARGEKG